MPQPPKTLNTFEAICQVIRDLRGPDGCPWDKEQTHQSLAQYAIEETHELAEALESGNDDHICEELGDVLFQVVLHAGMAEERGAFSINDVIEGIVSKIVRRHPHVYGATKVSGTGEVLSNWEEIKKFEKKSKPPSSKVFDIPPSLPALQMANKIGGKTEKYKFDWDQSSQVLQQLKFEVAELEAAMLDNGNPDHIRHELGDVLFSAAQLARHLNEEPETALREANRRFVTRFEKMLEKCGGLENFIQLSSAEKENLWKFAKQTT